MNRCLVSLFLGLTPELNQTVAPELKARDINRLRCTPSEMRIYAAPTIRQPAYITYLNLLPAYMHSCTQQITADVREFGHAVSIPLSQCLPFDYPDVCVTPKQESAEAHQALLDLGGFYSVIRGNKVYSFKRPDAETLKDIMKIGISKTSQCADNMVNMAALDSFRITRKVFSEFLLVHKYPAFVDPEHGTLFGKFQEYEVEEDMEVGEKRKRIEDAGLEARHKRMKADGKNKIESKSGVDVDGYPQDAITGREQIVRIKHIPPKAVQPFITSIQDIPSTWGLWAPYVSHLQFFDIHTVPRVIYRWFLGSLGNTREACLRGMESMKSDWGNLGNTEVGKEITHMALFIDAALNAQARPLPVFHNERYLGVFISGAGFEIKINGTSFIPTPFEDVMSQIVKSDAHTSALRRILELLGERNRISDTVAMGRPDHLLDPNFNMYRLRALCLAARVSEADKSVILEQARLLDFRIPHWGTNPSSLAKALHLITDIASPLPDDLPIHPSRLFNPDRIETVWSSFGFSAPSFRPISGRLISLSDKNYSVVVRSKDGDKTETRPFNHFHVSHLSLDQAVADLKEVQRSAKVGILVNPQRSAGNSNRRIEKDGFFTVLESLKKFASVENTSRVSIRQEVEPQEGDLQMDDDEF